MINSNKLRFGFLLLAIIFLTGATISAQERVSVKRDFCSSNWSNNDRFSTSDLRETTIAASDVNVDGKRNGGISVVGENRSDVLIRACVQAWAKSEAEANSIAKSVRVETNGTIQASSADGEKNYSVSYEIRVPRNSNLNLNTMNGGIRISNVEGNINFEANNGGVMLSNLAGDVKGKTANGGLKVELNGTGWKGAGLDVQTTNGGVKVEMPNDYAARFETKTVNGGFSTDFAELKVQRGENNRQQGINLSRDLNGGGATVRIVTTNGGVSVNSAN